MITNDQYIALLEKRAGEEDTNWDNAQTARQEYAANSGDNRSYLGGLFARAGESEDQMTASANRVLEGKHESGSPFIKVARDIFEQSIANTEFAKVASVTYREVAFRAFASELEKLAALQPQTMAQLTAKNRIAGAKPKVWDISSPVSAGASALREGSGTTLNQSGLLSRAAKALGFGK